jgi:hypothetical protein
VKFLWYSVGGFEYARSGGSRRPIFIASRRARNESQARARILVLGPLREDMLRETKKEWPYMSSEILIALSQIEATQLKDRGHAAGTRGTVARIGQAQILAARWRERVERVHSPGIEAP